MNFIIKAQVQVSLEELWMFIRLADSFGQLDFERNEDRNYNWIYQKSVFPLWTEDHQAGVKLGKSGSFWLD